jgi:uncharacterized protein (UPF0261 family)
LSAGRKGAPGERTPPAPSTVLLLGTLDTKGVEYAYVRERLGAMGVATLVVDAGTGEPQGIVPDIAREDLATAAGTTSRALGDAGDRGAAVEAMANGAAVVVRRLFDEGRFGAILAPGGSGGSSTAAAAMRALPVGIPELLVSTMASGDVRAYVGAVDVTLMNSYRDRDDREHEALQSDHHRGGAAMSQFVRRRGGRRRV